MNFTYTEQSSDYTFGIYNSTYTNVYYTLMSIFMLYIFQRLPLLKGYEIFSIY